jgi:hypothetical protein
MSVVTVYTARLTARAWKQTTCASCECVYRYRLERTSSKTAGRPELAQQQAVNDVEKQLKDAVENHPCPTCGLVQPDMVGSAKSAIHSTAATITLVALLLIAMVALAGGITMDFAGLLGAGVAGLAALIHLGGLMQNPNSARAANRSKAEAEVTAGVIDLVHPGAADRIERGPPNVTLLHLVLWLFVIGGGVAMLIPWHVRQTNAIPQNSERFAMPSSPVGPILIAPGDTATLRFPAKDNIESVEGLWQGKPTVEVLNPAEVGSTTLPVTTEYGSWGAQLQVDKNATKSSSNLYARVVLPDDPDLGGKEVRVRVTLAVTYPVAVTDKLFTDRSKTASETFTIKVGKREQIAFYREAFHFGAGVALVTMLIGGIGLVVMASALRRQARPTQLLFVDGGSPQSMQAAAEAESRRRWAAGRGSL